jgi:hypothetical protein
MTSQQERIASRARMPLCSVRKATSPPIITTGSPSRCGPVATTTCIVSSLQPLCFRRRGCLATSAIQVSTPQELSVPSAVYVGVFEHDILQLLPKTCCQSSSFLLACHRAQPLMAALVRQQVCIMRFVRLLSSNCWSWHLRSG